MWGGAAFLVHFWGTDIRGINLSTKVITIFSSTFQSASTEVSLEGGDNINNEDITLTIEAEEYANI